MSVKVNWATLTIIALLLATQVVAQRMDNFGTETIKSAKAYRLGNEVNDAVIDLNGNDVLRFEFDDISDEALSLDYTIVHCTHSWEPSELLFDEYANGFAFNSIDSRRNSMGTSTLYTHYQLNIPNSDVSLKLSGNYLLRVVEAGNHDKVLLQQRFRVVDAKVGVSARVVQPTNPQLKASAQQLELEINYAQLGSIDPFSEIAITITQNNQTYNAKENVRPVFHSGSKVRYSAPDSLLFGGGYEYRDLIFKSFAYKSNRFNNFNRYGGEYHLNLAPDASNRQLNYSETRDINGKYIIKRDDCTESNTEAEYIWFYFTLPSEQELNADVYIYGELTGWSIAPAFKMRYSHTDRAYQARVLLKQGIYNYRYITVDRTSGLATHHQFEGDYSNTENTYQIYVYHKPRGGRYWQLVSFSEIGSRN